MSLFRHADTQPMESSVAKTPPQVMSFPTYRALKGFAGMNPASESATQGVQGPRPSPSITPDPQFGKSTSVQVQSCDRGSSAQGREQGLGCFRSCLVAVGGVAGAEHYWKGQEASQTGVEVFWVPVGRNGLNWVQEHTSSRDALAVD